MEVKFSFQLLLIKSSARTLRVCGATMAGMDKYAARLRIVFSPDSCMCQQSACFQAVALEFSSCRLLLSLGEPPKLRNQYLMEIWWSRRPRHIYRVVARPAMVGMPVRPQRRRGVVPTVDRYNTLSSVSWLRYTFNIIKVFQWLDMQLLSGRVLWGGQRRRIRTRAVFRGGSDADRRPSRLNNHQPGKFGHWPSPS